jgi:hypothetical protein
MILDISVSDNPSSLLHLKYAEVIVLHWSLCSARSVMRVGDGHLRFHHDRLLKRWKIIVD